MPGGTLHAPFQWFGNKKRLAPEINRRLGKSDIYVEPFAGSLAVLLQRQPAQQEVVCDTDGAICNFWRSVAQDPELVAYWADWPTVQDDLTARHLYLRQWKLDHADRLRHDPDYCDPKMAGWWVWGLSNHVGRSWCTNHSDATPQIIDHVPNMGGGQGVSFQKKSLWRVGRHGHMKGIMWSLANRLARVIVLNRPWTSAVTRPALCAYDSMAGKRIAILMDPPYRTTSRAQQLYEADTTDDPAVESYRWSVENGERFRIAYCCSPDDFPVPPGWSATDPVKFNGFASERTGRGSEFVMFSPAVPNGANDQIPLFGN